MRTQHVLAVAIVIACPADIFAQDLGAPVRLEVDGQPIDSGAYIGHSGPLFADVTGDGRADLLVGTFKGHVQVYPDLAKSGEPRFENGGLLQAAGGDLKINNW